MNCLGKVRLSATRTYLNDPQRGRKSQSENQASTGSNTVWITSHPSENQNGPYCLHYCYHTSEHTYNPSLRPTHSSIPSQSATKINQTKYSQVMLTAIKFYTFNCISPFTLLSCCCCLSYHIAFIAFVILIVIPRSCLIDIIT